MQAFGFDNTFARELPGAYLAWKPAVVPAPRRLFLNEPLADELKLDTEALKGPEGSSVLVGNALPDGAEPIAQAYAGHQFGGFSPQLGDGRALLLGEVIDRAGRRRDIAFKGSGRTPFSRGGDGKAAVGPMLREVLIGEAMHALNIPTTRALAVVATGEQVYRERALPGAVLTRVAGSHLRVGTFQFFAARGDLDNLRRLADYTIARHDPERTDAPDRYLALLRAVAGRQAALIAQWMNVGFIHGVMNTDNMAISGETIDYGPCAFMEAYDPAAVFSSIDHGGRYAYGNQPHIARWNLARLAETLLPLMAAADDEAAVQRAVAQVMEVIDTFPNLYESALRQGQRAKLGLGAGTGADAVADAALADEWLALLHAQSVDFTLAWRRLADAAETAQTADTAQAAAVAASAQAAVFTAGAQAAVLAAGADAAVLTPGADAATKAATEATPRESPGAAGRGQGALRALFAEPTALDGWLARWRERCAQDDAAGGPGPHRRAAAMRRVSPWIIARNHRVEEALTAASEHNDLAPFERLLAALRRPFEESPEQAPYAEPAPAAVTAAYQTFCGT